MLCCRASQRQGICLRHRGWSIIALLAVSIRNGASQKLKITDMIIDSQRFFPFVGRHHINAVEHII